MEQNTNTPGHIMRQILNDAVLIPEHIVRLRGVSGNAKLLYGHINKLRGADGWAEIPVQKITDELGFTPERQRKYISELRSAGVVEVRTRNIPPVRIGRTIR